jgi:hypothetical protein
MRNTYSLKEEHASAVKSNINRKIAKAKKEKKRKGSS